MEMAIKIFQGIFLKVRPNRRGVSRNTKLIQNNVGHTGDVWRKLKFLMKILFFGWNFDFFTQILIFWPKFWFFDPNFDFWPKVRFFTECFWPKFRFWASFVLIYWPTYPQIFIMVLPKNVFYFLSLFMYGKFKPYFWTYFQNHSWFLFRNNAGPIKPVD